MLPALPRACHHSQSHPSGPFVEPTATTHDQHLVL
jgi:hypothetical protein